MALPATDDFSGLTNYTPLSNSANWTDSSTGVYHLSGRIYANAAGSTWGSAYWNADAFSDAQSSSIQVIGFTTFRYMGVTVFNAASTDDWYGFAGDGTVSLIVEKVSGTPSTLSGGLSALTTLDVLKLTTSVSAGTTTLTAYINDIQEAQTTDTSHTSGSAGVCCYGNSTGATADDWTGDDVGGGGGGFQAAWAYNSNQIIGM